MLKIRALNESSSSSDEEDEEHPRLSVEAQETQAKLLYEKAQTFTINKEFEQAVETFAEILQLPYLNVNEFEKKTLSPVQIQLRLGCLKCLSTLYTRGPTKNLEDASTVLELITEMEPKNVNFWYRLGKVALERKELLLAYEAFKCALDCSPGHWGSIEHLVTISFAVYDILGCFRYCAMGLRKDSGFLRGLVIKNHLFKVHPWAKEVVKNSNDCEILFLEKEPPVSDSCAQKYLTEARDLISEVSKTKLAIRNLEHEKANNPVKCPFTLKSITLLELGKIVFETYFYLKDSGRILRPVDMLSTQAEVLASEETTSDVNIQMNGECEEQISCASVILRSRSTSDDKDPVRESGNDSSRPANENSQVSENEDKLTEEDSQTVLPTQLSVEEESLQRRKNRKEKDVKWWQIEGQRRSQRVRGNLVAPPVKTKSESTFAEMLRSIIPDELLTEETCKKEKNYEKLLCFKSASISNRAYFGSDEERNDVKMLIGQWKCVDIIRIMSQFVHWLCNNCKTHWPSDLRVIFLKLYELYQNSVPINFFVDAVINQNPNVVDCISDIVFTSLVQTELSLDLNIPCANTFQLEQMSNVISNDEFLLRVEWLKLKNTLQQCQINLIDHTYTKLHLELILDILKRKPDGYTCILPTEHDSVISYAVVQEKLQYVKKIENLSKIQELYQNKQFEDLVEILHFGLSTDDDVQNRLYLTESYFSLGKIECVEQCEILVDTVTKCESDEQLHTVLKLLHNIWDGLKDKMTRKELKMIINMLLKILIRIEKQENCLNSFIITSPWCLLHSVLYHLEQMESALDIDDESAPCSILILQFGHETLNKVGKCSINEGHFLSYSITSLLDMDASDVYWSFEETKNCLDQAILCLYAHPSKKFKLKNVKDHGTIGIPMSWSVCCQLYNYFKLEELPEFDSKPNKSISAEVENLFQRITLEMPAKLQPMEQYQHLKEYVRGYGNITQPFELPSEKLEIPDIYYLLADFYFKNQDLNKAVEYYIWDLAISPVRFDSWTAIALTKAEEIVSKINACDAFKIEEIIVKSEAVIRCFQQSINLDVANTKVRIEFGSFLYSLHSVFSREEKFHSSKINPDIINEIEKRRSMYILQSLSLFEPYKVGQPNDIIDEDDAWINHYMLGKVAEKIHPTQPEKFLEQYALASQLLHEKCSTYPSKINYYNVQEYALEAMEVYFRIHASVLNYVGKVKEYTKEREQLLLKYLKTAEESPFIKSKQGRTIVGEGKRTKVVEDSVSKKDMAVINSLVRQMLEKVEKMGSKENSTGTSCSNSSTDSTSSEDDSNTNALPTSRLSRSAYKDVSQEEIASKLKLKSFELNGKESLTSEVQEVNQPKIQTLLPTEVEKNPYFKEFGDLPYGLVISMCLKAMKECVSRCPQYFKAFYRLAHAYVTFKKDFKTAREYLIGNNASGADKVTGLYGDRKPNNFFNGIWRHPIDDIDRPGSFAFYMSKSMRLLLTVLGELHDHQKLADVGIQLSKVPDSKNTYLYTEDREQYSKEAFKMCEVAARNSIPKDRTLLLCCGLSIYDTYTKFQKFNSKENHVASVLLEVYKRVLSNASQSESSEPLLADAVRFFQQVAWNRSTKTTGTGPRNFIGYPRPSEALSKANVDRPIQKLHSVPSINFPASMVKRQTINRRLSDANIEEMSSTVDQNSSPFASRAPIMTVPYLPPFNSSELMIAAQLASYNNDLHQHLQQFLNHRSSLDVMNSGRAVDGKSNQCNEPAKSKQDENMRQTQQIPPNPGGPFRTPQKYVRDQIIAFTENEERRISNMKRSKSKVKKFLPHRLDPSPVASDASRNSTQSSNLAAVVQQIKTPIDRSRVEMFVTSQIQLTKNPIGSALKDLPNISCTKVGSALPKLQPKPDIPPNLRPITNTVPQKPKSKPPPPNLVSPSYLSNSPFQAQATAMANPVIPGRYSLTASQRNSHSNSPSPQPAHSQAVVQPRYSATSTFPAHSQPMHYSRLTSSSHQPEVVDLTTKSPDKNANKSSQDHFTKSRLNITRMLDKSASNSQHNFMDSYTSVTLTKVPTTTTKPMTAANAQSYESSNSSPDENVRQIQRMSNGNIGGPFRPSPEIRDNVGALAQSEDGRLAKIKARKAKAKAMAKKVNSETASNPSVMSWEMIMSKAQNHRPHSMSMQINNSHGGGATNNTHITASKVPVTYSSPSVISLPQNNNNNNNNKQPQPHFLTPKVVISSSSRPMLNQPASRPLKRSLPAIEKSHHYPLPPKKKHHILPISPPPIEDDPDFDVITIE